MKFDIEKWPRSLALLIATADDKPKGAAIVFGFALSMVKLLAL